RQRVAAGEGRGRGGQDDVVGEGQRALADQGAATQRQRPSAEGGRVADQDVAGGDVGAAGVVVDRAGDRQVAGAAGRGQGPAGECDGAAAEGIGVSHDQGTANQIGAAAVGVGVVQGDAGSVPTAGNHGQRTRSTTLADRAIEGGDVAATRETTRVAVEDGMVG